jgi:hypothetical protein
VLQEASNRRAAEALVVIQAFDFALVLQRQFFGSRMVHLTLELKYDEVLKDGFVLRFQDVVLGCQVVIELLDPCHLGTFVSAPGSRLKLLLDLEIRLAGQCVSSSASL